MKIQSDMFRIITQALHVIGAPTIVNVGVCGTSLVCIAEHDSGLTLYMSAEQGISQDCQAISMYSRQMRVIANHAPGILTIDNNTVRTADGAMRWNLFPVIPPTSLAVPPEITNAFQVGSRQQFLAALSSVVSSGSGDASVQNEGPNWTIVCPKSWAWSVIRTEAPPVVIGQAFLVRKDWASAILGMLQGVAGSDGELLFSIADGQVVIGWYSLDRSAMVSIVIPHEQSSVEPLAENMQWLGTVDAAAFHRAISALEAATAPDEAATLSMTETLNMGTDMLQLGIPVLDGPSWWPIEVWINTAPTRWMASDGTIELWLSKYRLYAGSKSLTASWRTV